MPFSWPAIKALAEDTSYRFVALSPLSKTLADSSYSFFYQMFNWSGAGFDLTEVEIDEIKAAVDKLMAELEQEMLIGSFMPYAGENPPKGCLACNGAAYLRVDYPALYEYLSGTPYIVDADHFETPFFPGRVVAAPDDDHDLYSEFGEAAHTQTIEELAEHGHNYTPPVANVDLESPGAPDIFAAGVGVIQVSTTLTGESQPFNVIQPTVYFNWGIVAGA